MPVAPKFKTPGVLHTRARAADDPPNFAAGILLAMFANLQHGFAYDTERPQVEVLLGVISRDAPDEEPMSIGEKHLRARQPWFAIRINESVIDYLDLPRTSPIEYVRLAADMYVLACAAVKADLPPPMRQYVDQTELSKVLKARAAELGVLVAKQH
jgi:hypothetical protein